MLELSYTRSKFDDVQLTSDDKDLNDALLTLLHTGEIDQFSSYGFMYYLGKTFNSGQRFQVPIYIGLGAEYFSGWPYHNLLVDVGAKIRMKYFFSQRFGLFVGATGKYGFGSSERFMKKDSKDTPKISRTSIDFDAGLTILIN